MGMVELSGNDRLYSLVTKVIVAVLDNGALLLNIPQHQHTHFISDVDTWGEKKYWGKISQGPVGILESFHNGTKMAVTYQKGHLDTKMSSNSRVRELSRDQLCHEYQYTRWLIANHALSITTLYFDPNDCTAKSDKAAFVVMPFCSF